MSITNIRESLELNDRLRAEMRISSVAAGLLGMPLIDLVTLGRTLWARAKAAPAVTKSPAELSRQRTQQGRTPPLEMTLERFTEDATKRAIGAQPLMPKTKKKHKVDLDRPLTIERFFKEQGYSAADIKTYSSRFSRRLADDYHKLYGNPPPKVLGKNCYTEQHRELFTKLLRRSPGKYPKYAHLT